MRLYTSADGRYRTGFGRQIKSGFGDAKAGDQNFEITPSGAAAWVNLPTIGTRSKHVMAAAIPRNSFLALNCIFGEITDDRDAARSMNAGAAGRDIELTRPSPTWRRTAHLNSGVYEPIGISI